MSSVFFGPHHPEGHRGPPSSWPTTGVFNCRKATRQEIRHSTVAGHEVDKVGSACNWVGGSRAGPMWPSEPTVCEASAALAPSARLPKLPTNIVCNFGPDP